MLSCGPTKLEYGGFTNFTELAKSGFVAAFFFPDIGGRVEVAGSRVLLLLQVFFF